MLILQIEICTRLIHFGEKLLNSWDMREANTRTAGVYFQKNSEIVEVFNVEAPTNYYFESLVWSPDGQ